VDPNNNINIERNILQKEYNINITEKN